MMRRPSCDLALAPRAPPSGRLAGLLLRNTQGAHRLVTVALLLVACNDEVAGSVVPLVEVCGTRGPHRLLTLDSAVDEQLIPQAGITRIGQHLFFITTPRVGESGAFPNLPWEAETTLYATGPCGEDPVVIAYGIRQVFADPRWPDRILGCRGPERDLLALDPHGSTSPELLAAGGCGARRTEHGLVWIWSHLPEEGGAPYWGGAVFAPYVDGGPAVGAKVDLISNVPYTPEYGVKASATDNAVFALDYKYDLMRISLPAGQVTLEQPNVHAFELTPDGRFLVWQGGGLVFEPMVGDIFLRDRSTGDDMWIGHGDLLGGRAIHERYVAPPDGDLLLLPELKPLPGVRSLHHQARDGRWLASNPWRLIDLETGEAALLTETLGDAGYATEDFLDLLHDDDTLWRYPYDLGPARQLARRRGRYTPLADGRIVMLVDLDSRWFGDLVLIDPVTLDELFVDSHVSGAASFHDWQGVFAPDVAVYAVSDGERSGVWMIRPATE